MHRKLVGVIKLVRSFAVIMGRTLTPTILHFLVFAGLTLDAAADGVTSGITVGPHVDAGDVRGIIYYNGKSPDISADGRYVVFQYYLDNLLTEDDNGTDDIFVYDRVSGEITRASVASDGAQGVGLESEIASISGNGNVVIFWSYFTNLVPDDTNRLADIFVHDRISGQTTRVNVNSSGAQANADSLGFSISGTGRFVAFASEANNLVPDDTNRTDDLYSGNDIFVHDRSTGDTTRVSVDSSGRQANDSSYRPIISADGNLVVFGSSASNLVPDDTNESSDAFIHDRISGLTTRISVDSRGSQGSADSYATSVSADGRFVSIISDASNLIPGDTNESSDVLIHDRTLGQTTRVSVDSQGMQGNRDSYSASISANGRFIAFGSLASNLVPGDTNIISARRGSDVFVHDTVTGKTTRVSVDSDGLEGNNDSSAPAISGDGCAVVFESRSSNLVPDDINEVYDIFVHQRDPAETLTPMEPNDEPAKATDISPCWRHYHARLPDRSRRGWDLARQGEGIFEDYNNLDSVPPMTTADVWTKSLTGLSLNSEIDRDFFRTWFPDPRYYSGSNDIRPKHRRLADGTPKSMPECDVVQRQSWSPGTGSELVNVSLSGRLDVTVIPTVSAGDSAVDPSDEVIYVYRDGASPPVASGNGPALRLSIYCPQSGTGLALDEVLISIGERAEVRPWSRYGDYTLQLDYIIEARRGIPKWVNELAEFEGLRTLLGLPCPLPGSGAFPHCASGPEPRVELVHPHTPRLFDCIADGPGCWDPLLITLPTPMKRMEMLFSAHPKMTFELYDADKKVIAQAKPFAKEESQDGEPRLASRLLVDKLQTGHYVLMVNGPPGSYEIDYPGIEQKGLKHVGIDE